MSAHASPFASSVAAPLPTNRAALLQRLRTAPECDVLIIGGGATGLGTALDAAARGLSVVLVDSHDWAQGTSSRATKLVHGGVRYLAQGNIALVREALHERKNLLANAPHLAQPLPFVMPSYKLLDTPFYGAGLKLYDALAGADGLGRTEFLSPASTRQLLPGVRTQGLKGGVKYWDGQFDDARLALALARTALTHGALLLNYVRAERLLHESGRVVGAVCQDVFTQEQIPVRARCTINATGCWVDTLRQQDAQATGRTPQAIVAPSQGVHLVVDARFWPGQHALLVPKTADGRVLFAVPWLGKVILGTTDTARTDLPRDPEAFEHEVDFILREAANYLAHAPTRADVLSVWAGLRPLVKPQQSDAQGMKSGQISREHTVLIDPSGLVSVTGGKWTTYRAMAEDVLAACARAQLLNVPAAGVTRQLPLVGASASHANVQVGAGHLLAQGVSMYGNEAPWLEQLPGANNWVAPQLSEAMIRFAVRHEWARTVEDVLARRSRWLFLDAGLAQAAAPAVAAILAQELPDADVGLAAFEALCHRYRLKK